MDGVEKSGMILMLLGIFILILQPGSDMVQLIALVAWMIGAPLFIFGNTD